MCMKTDGMFIMRVFMRAMRKIRFWILLVVVIVVMAGISYIVLYISPSAT